VNHLSILVLVVTMLVPLFFQPITVQDPNVIILKFNWKKERIPGWENNKFGPSFETYDAMRSRVASERRLQQARNAGNKSEASRIENDLKARQEANTPKTKEERSEPPRDGYKYRLWIRNTGEKTIRSIDWDYIFLDPDSNEEVARHQFTSDAKIGSGKEKELSVFILSPPVRITRAQELGKKEFPFTGSVKIIRIEYVDGSIWQHP